MDKVHSNTLVTPLDTESPTDKLKVFIAYDGDGVNSRIEQAMLADQADEAVKIGSAVDSGNHLWKLWAQAKGGRIIVQGGDQGCLQIGADHLSDIIDLRRQYEERVGSTCSIGVGKHLSEANQALLACKLRGGNQIKLFGDEVKQILSEYQDEAPPEESKLFQSRLETAAMQATGVDLSKGMESDAKFRSVRGAGFQSNIPPQGGQISAPIKTNEVQAGADEGAKVHSLKTVAAGSVKIPSPEELAPEEAQPDYVQDFENLAQQSINSENSKKGQEPQQDELKQKLVQTLKEFKSQTPMLESLKDSDPKLYQTLVDVVQSMILMAQKLYSPQPVQKSEELEKALPKSMAENRANAQGFLNHPVNQDAYIEGTGAVPVQHTTTNVVGTPGVDINHTFSNPAAKIAERYFPGEDLGYQAHAANFHTSRNPATPRKLPIMTPYLNIDYPHITPDYTSPAHQNHEKDFWQDTEAQSKGISLAALRAKAAKGIKERKTPATAILDADPNSDFGKAALEAGKTGRHHVILPVGARKDSGPTGTRDVGKIKIMNPNTNHSQWRSVRSNQVMDPTTGTPTSSRNVPKPKDQTQQAPQTPNDKP
jgi:hypothetical protein